MVYCGGLENRFGLTPDGGSNPSLSASPAERDCRAEAESEGGPKDGCCELRLAEPERKFDVNIYISIGIWAALILVAFIVLWRMGYIARLSTYVQATREELKKCTWPTWDELKGSTVVVAISIVLLGGFTVVVDRIFFEVFIKIL